jgi:hypothetical protein
MLSRTCYFRTKSFTVTLGIEIGHSFSAVRYNTIERVPSAGCAD